MPTTQNTTRACRLCERSEPDVNFPATGRICNGCRYKRRVFMRENPGAPHLSKAERDPIMIRLMRHCEIAPNGCWNWTASKDKQGYGYISHVNISGTSKRRFGVHRLVAFLVHGLDLENRNEYACHRCDNPACFNPDHIFVGTPKDNSDDCKAKGRERHQKGEANGGGGKLSEADVTDIRAWRTCGFRQQQIAEAYGIHQTMVSRIDLGKEWRHVA